MISVFDDGPPPPCPAPFNLAAHVLGRSAALGSRTALEVLGPGGEVFSHARLLRAVQGTGGGLAAAGVAPGDIVLLRLGNTVDFPIAYLGAIALGAVPVPTSSQLTEREVATIIAELGPRLILHDAGVACPDHPGRTGLATLRAMRDAEPLPFHMGDPDRLGYIVYTSGTSGRPRAVAHAHRAILARAMMHEGWYGLRPDDRLLHAGAFNWTYTLGAGLMDPWSVGATALIPAPGTDPGDIPALLRDHGATIFAAVPGVYRKLLNSGADMRLPALRHGLSAGEKLSPALAEAWQAATGTPLYEAYGMSECSTFISASPVSPATGGALGRPQTGRRVAILGEDGPVPRGHDGVIAVSRRDPGLMLGYLGQPEETAARFRGEWFVTGDQGRMEADGQIQYLGRADDMMNAGGYRVSPLEVEAALSGFPGITQIGVTEIEVKADVRIICAFYTGPGPVDHAELARFAQSRLARYKQPKDYVYLPDLPTGANGKLLRRALKPPAGRPAP